MNPYWPYIYPWQQQLQPQYQAQQQFQPLTHFQPMHQLQSVTQFQLGPQFQPLPQFQPVAVPQFQPVAVPQFQPNYQQQTLEQSFSAPVAQPLADLNQPKKQQRREPIQNNKNEVMRLKERVKKLQTQLNNKVTATVSAPEKPKSRPQLPQQHVLGRQTKKRKPNRRRYEVMRLKDQLKKLSIIQQPTIPEPVIATVEQTKI